MPITMFDAAPATGGPSGGPAIAPTVPVGMEDAAEVTEASVMPTGRSLPILLAVAAGLFLLSRRT
jgi:hypothetical protein